MGDDQNVKGDLKVEKFIGILYDIDGVYGQVSHVKIVNESDLDATFGTYILPNKHNNQPDVKFNVSIRDCLGNTLLERFDIEGLPSFLNIDMGTYFRMAQLREMKNNKITKFVCNNGINKDNLIEEVVEKVMQKAYDELMKNGILNK